MEREAVQRGARLSSIKGRRLRYRQEMVDAILAEARAVMQEQGVAALNLNEVARRLGVSSQALAKYFPNKTALYDALFLLGHQLFRKADEHVWQTTRPDWERIRQWFEVRLALACEHPDLYHLIWENSVPGFVPSEASLEDIRLILAETRNMIGEVIEAGGLDAGLPVERVVDMLLAVRHGIIAEHLGKRDFLPPGSDRFSGLVPDILVVFEQAWGGTRQHSSRTTDDTSPTRRAGGKEGGSTKSIPPTDPRIY
jgi:AcrR family transcriptional regulator